MSMQVTQDKKGNLLVEAENNNFVVYVNNKHFEGFAIKYKVDNKFYYQHLMLSVRAGAQSYFSAAKALYRHLKQNKLTTTSFRKLAV